MPSSSSFLPHLFSFQRPSACDVQFPAFSAPSRGPQFLQDGSPSPLCTRTPPFHAPLFPDLAGSPVLTQPVLLAASDHSMTAPRGRRMERKQSWERRAVCKPPPLLSQRLTQAGLGEGSHRLDPPHSPHSPILLLHTVLYPRSPQETLLCPAPRMSPCFCPR